MSHSGAMAALPTVACCLCGIPMSPNPARMCANCLRSQVDITANIMRQLVVQRCKQCLKWNKPPFVHCEMESKELLALCLKKVKGMSHDCRIVDAAFLWTEPNSKRLKLKIVLQQEVVHGAVLQQTVTVDVVVASMQCDACKRSFTPHTWEAIVQVRQRVEHKRTLLYLEQLILKHDAHDKVIYIEEKPLGLDFQFAHKHHAESFLTFVASHFPTKKTQSKQLVSHDPKSNSYFYKHSYSLDLCPVCKDDLVYIPPKQCSQLGGVSPLLLCHKVLTGIHLMDPFTLKFVDIAAEKYWKLKFDTLLTRRHLTEFVIIDVENDNSRSPTPINPTAKQQPNPKAAYRTSCKLANVEVARAADLGVNDNRCVVLSHLGQYLKAGDRCLGYDLRTINLSGVGDMNAATGASNLIYDIILVRKVPQAGNSSQRRKWLLNTLPKQTEDSTMDASAKSTGGGVHKRIRGGGIHKRRDNDLEEFMQDLENDAELRKNVNIWRDPRVPVTTNNDESDAHIDQIQLAEMLEGLTLEDTIDESFVGGNQLKGEGVGEGTDNDIIDVEMG